MHHSLTSREQDLDATPTHQRLLSNLGILAKSQTHSDALHALLKKDNNHDHRAPANPKAMIRRASPDMTLTPAQRKRAQREDSRQESEYLRRVSELRDKGGVNDEDGDETLGADGVPVTRGMKRARGSFERMRKALAAKATDSVETLVKSLQTMYGPRATMAKALAEQDASGEGFEERYGIPAHAIAAQAVGVKTIRAAVKPSMSAKPTLATIRKSLDKAASLMKSMGLEVSYDSDSAKLTGGDAIRKQSLDKSRVFGTTVGGDVPAAPKRYTAEQIERAASAALAAGKLTGAQANSIATYIAMGSMPPPELLACLTDESA